jgi:hypothetical protein
MNIYSKRGTLLVKDGLIAFNSDLLLLLTEE